MTRKRAAMVTLGNKQDETSTNKKTKESDHPYGSRRRGNSPMKVPPLPPSSDIVIIYPRDDGIEKNSEMGRRRRTREEGSDDEVEVVFDGKLNEPPSLLIPDTSMDNRFVQALNSAKCSMLEIDLKEAKKREDSLVARFNSCTKREAEFVRNFYNEIARSKKLEEDLKKANEENAAVKEELMRAENDRNEAERRANTAQLAIKSKPRTASEENEQLKKELEKAEATIKRMFDQMTTDRKNREAEAELKQYEMEGVKKNLDGSEKELKMLKAKLEEVEEELKTEKGWNAKFSQQNADYRKNLSSATDENTTLTEELEDLKEKYSSANSEIAKLTDDLNHFKEMGKSTELEMTKLRDEISDLKEKFKVAQDEVVKLNGELDEYKEMLLSANAEIDTLIEEKHASANSHIEKLTEDLNNFKQTVNSTEMEMTKLREEISDSNEKFKVAQDEVVKLNGELDEYKKKLSSANAEINTKIEEVEKLNRTVKRMTDMYINQRDRANTQEDKLDMKPVIILAHNEKIANLQSQIAELNVIKDELREDSLAKVNHASSIEKELRLRINELEQENSRLNNLRTAMEMQIHRQYKEITEQKGQISEAKEQLMETRKRCGDMDKEMIELRDNQEKREEELERILDQKEKELREVTAVHHNEKEQLKASNRTEIEGMTARINDLMGEISELKGKIPSDSSMDELVKLRKDIDELSKANVDLVQQRDNMENEKDRMFLMFNKHMDRNGSGEDTTPPNQHDQSHMNVNQFSHQGDQFQAPYLNHATAPNWVNWNARMNGRRPNQGPPPFRLNQQHHFDNGTSRPPLRFPHENDDWGRF